MLKIATITSVVVFTYSRKDMVDTEHLFNDGENSDDSSKWEFQKWEYSLNHLGKEIHMCMEGHCSAYIYWYLKRFYGLMGDTDKRSPTSEGEITKNGYIMAHMLNM